jgi:biotin carboxyl carrier protein
MKYIAVVDGEEIPVDISKQENKYYLTFKDKRFTVDAFRPTPQSLSMLVEGKSYEVGLEKRNGNVAVYLYNDTITLELIDARKYYGTRETRSSASAGPLNVQAPMPGKIVKLTVQQNAVVQEGDALLVMEAMKMQNEIKAPKAGTVTRIHVQEGEPVSMSQTLVVLE